MYSEKMKKMSRPLIAIIMLCMVFTMAPLLPMSDSEVQAETAPTIAVFKNEKAVKTLDQAAFDALDAVKCTYSSINSLGSSKTYIGEGPTVASVLKAAGLNTAEFKPETQLTFISSDDKSLDPTSTELEKDTRTTVTWKVLSETRYTYSDGQAEAPAMLNSFTDKKNPRRLYVGQLNKDDANNKYMAKDVRQIYINDLVNVKLDATKGKITAASITAYAGKTYGTIAKATRKDYKFNGWFTVAKKGTEVKADTVVKDGDHTIYAQWTGTNKYLKSIKLSKGKLNKKFKKTKTKYTVKLKANQSKTKITPKKAQSVAKIKIKVGKGKWKSAKSATVKVAKGKTKTVKIKVISQSKSSKTYTVKVKRAK